MASPIAIGVYAGLGVAACAGVAAGVYAYASMWPGSRLFGSALTAPARPGEIALTFDDGPNATWTPRLLDILSTHDIRATFFPARPPGESSAGARAANRCGRARHRKSHLVASQPGTKLFGSNSRRTETHSTDASPDHRRTGEVFPAALWSAPAGSVSDRARNWSRTGAVERNGARLERSLPGPDCDAVDEQD